MVLFIKAKCIFNDDYLKSGPLNYSYSLTTLPFIETGNDTISKEGNKVLIWKSFKSSDFDKLKSYLDKKYGNGIIATINGNYADDTTYKYETVDADVLLTHNKR